MKHLWANRIIKNNYFLLFVLWFILTAINVNKAFHIDDAFHLAVSEYLIDNLTKPMSGIVIWGDDLSSIYEHNQPPLFFYFIAFFLNIFGPSEIPLHLFLSVFTFLALYFFQKTTKIILAQNKNTLLILFALNAALIINQNLMADIPILAIIMGMAYFLIKTNYSNNWVNYILVSLLLGVGLLIKYSLLPLIVVLILVIVLKRDYKKLIVLLIPILMLSAWSFWNYLEYGSVHILDRPSGGVHINQFWAFMACIGSVSAFSISFALGVFRSKIIKAIVFFVLAIFIVSVMLFYYDLIPELQYSKYLNVLFIVNGFIVWIALLIGFLWHIKDGLMSFIKTDSFIVFLFLSSLSSFIILFAPFISTRHILLVIPFILLFGHELISKASNGINRLSIVLTVILGLLLGISDWRYADYYREMASSIDLPQDKNIWAAGLWGWQWYAKKNGMKLYYTSQLGISVGDYIVCPGDISPQKINKNISLEIIDKKWQEADILTFFSGNNFASLYNSSVDHPPWSLSKTPIDTIYIFEIRAIK